MVAGAGILLVASWFLPDFYHLWFTRAENEIYSLDGHGALLPESWVIYWGFYIAWVVAYIGLFRFHAPSRTIFLVLLLTDTGFSLLWGFRVVAPLDAFIGGLGSIADGVILAVVYLMPIRDQFKK